MKTWEMIKALTENPKLKFKFTDYAIEMTHHHVEVVNGRICWGGDNNYPLYIVMENNDKWELIPQEIPFLEAVKAFSEGKTIRCEYNCYSYTYIPNENTKVVGDFGHLFLSTCGCRLTTRDVLEGRWYIID